MGKTREENTRQVRKYWRLFYERCGLHPVHKGQPPWLPITGRQHFDAWTWHLETLRGADESDSE